MAKDSQTKTVLYLGDVVGEAGLSAVAESIDRLRADYAPDIIIAQGENLSGGRGINLADFGRLRDLGIDGVTGGNWSLHHKEIEPLLADPKAPIVAPANWLQAAKPGWKRFEAGGAEVLLISLLGQIFSRRDMPAIQNPLLEVDRILMAEGFDSPSPPDLIIVNLHGDFSSEKKTIGYYLDGRASLVVGDHWHIQSNDAAVLPAKTAHITDVGMCGSLHSSLGVSFDCVIPRWRDGKTVANRWDEAKPWQICGVLARFEGQTAKACQTVRLVID